MENVALANALEELKNQYGLSLREVARETNIGVGNLSQARAGTRKGTEYLPRVEALLQTKRNEPKGAALTQTREKAFLQTERDIRQFEREQKAFNRLATWAIRYTGAISFTIMGLAYYRLPGLYSSQMLSEEMVIQVALRKQQHEEAKYQQIALMLAERKQAQAQPQRQLMPAPTPRYIPQQAVSLRGRASQEPGAMSTQGHDMQGICRACGIWHSS